MSGIFNSYLDNTLNADNKLNASCVFPNTTTCPRSPLAFPPAAIFGATLILWFCTALQIESFFRMGLARTLRRGSMILIRTPPPTARCDRPTLLGLDHRIGLDSLVRQEAKERAFSVPCTGWCCAHPRALHFSLAPLAPVMWSKACSVRDAGDALAGCNAEFSPHPTVPGPDTI